MPEEEWEWNETGVDAVALEDSDEQLMYSITHFFSTLKVEGLKVGTVERLMDAGLDSIIKIAKSSPAKMGAAIGSERNAAKIRASISQRFKEATHASLMDASGLFGRTFGTRRCQMILDEIPYAQLSKLKKAQLIDAVSEVRGMSSKSATLFADGFPRYVKFIAQLGITPSAPKKVKITGSSLKGETIVFTGFRDSELEKAIQANGGSIGSSVNGSTTILVIKDAGSTSTKTAKAKQMGIKIIPVEAFRKKYKL
jgi:NAD-dependent DNA ligase